MVQCPWAYPMKRFVKCFFELLTRHSHDKAPRGHTWGCGIMVEVAKWQGIWVLPLGFCQFTFLGRDTMLRRYALR